VWKFLISALSGSLCASFEGMDPDRQAFSGGRPLNIPWAQPGNQLRFATLPYEAVCTENLTPWLKLLPCGKRLGLASLFAPLDIADSPLASLSLKAGSHHSPSRVELIASLDVVLPVKSGGIGFVAWFGSSSKTFAQCSAADTSDVQVWPQDSQLPESLQGIGLAAGSGKGLVIPSSRFAEIKDSRELLTNLQGRPMQGAQATGASLSVMRDVLSQEGKSERTHGRYLLRFTNVGMKRRVLFMDQLPFFMRPLWHTLQATFQVSTGAVEELDGVSAMQRLQLKFVPSDGQGLPTEVFLSVDVPHGGIVSVSFNVLKSFLQLREFSYACEKGFDVGSAAWLERGVRDEDALEPVVIGTADFSAPLQQSRPDEQWQLRFTEGLLVLVPMPDFSMPFNVIALSSTAVTFFFGSLFRLTAAGRIPHWVLKKEEQQRRRTWVFWLQRLLLVALVGGFYALAVAEPAQLANLRQALPPDAAPLADLLEYLKPQVEQLMR